MAEISLYGSSRGAGRGLGPYRDPGVTQLDFMHHAVAVAAADAGTMMPGTMMPLPADVVHVWLVRPDALNGDAILQRYEALLTPADRARRDRLLRADGRRDFTITRALLRTTLSRYAPVPPEAWRFVTGEHGKPAIDAPADLRWLSFNLSHTRGLIACIVGCAMDIGVDVEDRTRGRRTSEVADRFFAPAEVAALRALPAAAQRDRFFAYWTLKESYIKARGLGLAIPLEQFAFVLSDNAISIGFDAALGDDDTQWQFGLWEPTLDHTAAWAARVGGAERPITSRVWEVVPFVGPHITS